MSRYRHAKPAVAVLVLSAVFALPTTAPAAGGGTAASDPSSNGEGSTGGSTGGTAPPPPGSATLQAPRAALMGRRQLLRGSAGSSGRGRSVLIQLYTAGSWSTVAQATTGSGGAFSTRWRPTRAGRLTLRAVPGGATAARDETAGVARVTVYRPHIATWYGPGFYGNGTACGKHLTTRTLGVANRTLPCGTRVALYYRGRTITVPVIDRGPYGPADYDLTGATARALHFDGRATIGANPLSHRTG